MPGRTAQEVSSDAMKNRFRHAVVKVPGPMLLDVDRGGPDFPFWAGHQCHSWPENSPKIGDLRRRSPNSLVLGLGWRGYLLPRLSQTGWPYPLLLTGLIWG